MELVTPGLGLIVWTSLFFLIVLFLLRKFAWKVILDSVDARNKSIEEALKAAERARAEMAQLKNENEALLQQARAEREKMLRDAKATADRLISEAQEKATAEAQRIIKQAQETIQNEKNAALTEVKNQIAALALELAEKVLRNKLNDRSAQEELVKAYMKDLKVN
ncbi:MAG: F0F1 ATP synthase subunit B [Cytophagales bacterium]|nr:F0F1 ATP synthase subunit B [Bernardetiaceae bacterium]MDW8204591.1 F0F1 ATP synthase subunit B [Cytophagales bacterium]